MSMALLKARIDLIWKDRKSSMTKSAAGDPFTAELQPLLSRPSKSAPPSTSMIRGPMISFSGTG